MLGYELLSIDGSPPPARGAPVHPKPRTTRRGITPACAGSTPRPRRRAAAAGDHPRLRGEHCNSMCSWSNHHGSPPPARGARRSSPTAAWSCRITPACAGSTRTGRSRRTMDSDHPRLRGEHHASDGANSIISGSPPPARGAHAHVRQARRGPRITPACAGSTSPSRSATTRARDHPRLRGEHDTADKTARRRFGSPPPARGALQS